MRKWHLKLIDMIEKTFQKSLGEKQFPIRRIERAAEESLTVLNEFLTSAGAVWLRSVENPGEGSAGHLFRSHISETLSGKIDLFVKDIDRHWIVDYKTDSALSETSRKIYAEQMNLYKAALSAVFPFPHSARLLLIRTGEILDL